MANYTRATNFTAKDALSSGNPSKVILGSEHDAEYNAIATAIATKLDDINSLSSETTIEEADLEIFYDVSASSHKKITRINKQRPILQIVHATDAGSSHSNTSYTNMNSSTVSITPKSATSKLLIEVTFHGICNIVAEVNTKATFQLYETPSTGIGFQPELATALTNLGARTASLCSIRHQLNSTGTSTRSFGLQGKQSGGATISAVKMVWTITEYL